MLQKISNHAHRHSLPLLLVGTLMETNVWCYLVTTSCLLISTPPGLPSPVSFTPPLPSQMPGSPPWLVRRRIPGKWHSSPGIDYTHSPPLGGQFSLCPYSTESLRAGTLFPTASTPPSVISRRQMDEQNVQPILLQATQCAGENIKKWKSKKFNANRSM